MSRTQKAPGSVPEGWQVLGAVAPGHGVTIDGEPQQPRGWDHFHA